MARSIFACIVLVVLFLIMASTSTTKANELPDSRCYDFPENGTHFGCDAGRCCSTSNYCGNTTDYCCGTDCLFQCTGSGCGGVVLSIYNFTSNACYDDQNSLSCANSLKNFSSASLHKYAWASFRVNNNVTTCSRCLKLTNVRNGVEAMVRVVHEPDQLGLELGAVTFNKLNGGRESGDYHHQHHDLVVKYSFESCD